MLFHRQSMSFARSPTDRCIMLGFFHSTAQHLVQLHIAHVCTKHIFIKLILWMVDFGVETRRMTGQMSQALSAPHIRMFGGGHENCCCCSMRWAGNVQQPLSVGGDQNDSHHRPTKSKWRKTTTKKKRRYPCEHEKQHVYVTKRDIQIFHIWNDKKKNRMCASLTMTRPTGHATSEHHLAQTHIEHMAPHIALSIHCYCAYNFSYGTIFILHNSREVCCCCGDAKCVWTSLISIYSRVVSVCSWTLHITCDL